MIKKILIGDQILSSKYVHSICSGLSIKSVDFSSKNISELSFDIFSGSLFEERSVILIKGFSILKEHTEFLIKIAGECEDIILLDNTDSIKQEKGKFSAKASIFIKSLEQLGFELVNNFEKLKKDFSSIDFLRKYSSIPIKDDAAYCLIDFGNGSKSYCMSEIDKMSLVLDSITYDDILVFCARIPEELDLYELSNVMDKYDIIQSIDMTGRFIKSNFHELVILEVIQKKFKWRMLAFEFYAKKEPISSSLFNFSKGHEYNDSFYEKWGFNDIPEEKSKADVLPLPFISKMIEDSLRFNICNRIKSRNDLIAMRNFLISSYSRANELYRATRKDMKSAEINLFLLVQEYCSAKDFANSLSNRSA